MFKVEKNLIFHFESFRMKPNIFEFSNRLKYLNEKEKIIMLKENKGIMEKYEKPVLIELGEASDLIAGNGSKHNETHVFKPCQDGSGAASHTVYSKTDTAPVA